MTFEMQRCSQLKGGTFMVVGAQTKKVWTKKSNHTQSVFFSLTTDTLYINCEVYFLS